jgi:hypothetical protein
VKISLPGGKKMSTSIIDNRAIWDAFVETSPDRLLYFQWDFLKIIEKHSGYTLLPYGIFDDRTTELLSIFPLFYYKKWGMKFVFSQPPRSLIPYMGFLMNPGYHALRQRDKETMLNQVAVGITREIEALAPNYTYISFSPHVQDIRPFLWKGFDPQVQYTYTFDVTLPLETLWNAFSKSTKKEIRGAEKHQIVLQETTDTTTFLSIMKERYHQQGLKFPLYGLDYLNDILTQFPRNLKMFFLYDNDAVINLGTYFDYNSRKLLWIGGVSIDKTIPSNEFLLWETIKKSKAEGIKILDFGGADTERLCFFKSKFNPSLESSFSVIKKDLIGKTSEFVYLTMVKRE